MNTLWVLLHLAGALLFLTWMFGYLLPHIRLGNRLSAAMCVLGTIGMLANAYGLG